MNGKQSMHDFYLARRLARRAFYRQGGLCFWCNQPMVLTRAEPNVDDPRLMTADHHIPRYAGGVTRPGNIVAACYGCNNSRNIETNHTKIGTTFTAGDTEPRSPFEILRDKIT
jgi:hypothetical protein